MTEARPDRKTAATPRRPRRWLQILIPLLILGGSLAAFAALKATRAQRPPVEVVERAWLVQTQTIAPSRLAPDLVLYGRVESPRSATLTAAVSSDVLEVPAREGMQVVAGDLLVALDEREMQFDLAQREADVAEAEAAIVSEQTRYQADLDALEMDQRLMDLARSELNRLVDLQKRGLGSESQRDTARQGLEQQGMSLISRKQAIQDHDARRASLEARLARARASRDRARLDLERTRIVAPFAGRVTRVDASPGNRVRIGDPLMDLYDFGAVEVRAQIPSRQLGTVKEALAASGTLTARTYVDGVEVALALDRLAGKADAASGGVDALFRVEGGTEQLTIGRVVRVVLAMTPLEGMVAVPYEALYGLDTLYRLQDERMQAVRVERIGEQRRAGERAKVLVRSPELQDGDQIVVTQLPNAVSGLKVTVAQPDGG
jgi:RND family efflux transporter MFP subunit